MGPTARPGRHQSVFSEMSVREHGHRAGHLVYVEDEGGPFLESREQHLLRRETKWELITGRRAVRSTGQGTAWSLASCRDRHLGGTGHPYSIHYEVASPVSEDEGLLAGGRLQSKCRNVYLVASCAPRDFKIMAVLRRTWQNGNIIRPFEADCGELSALMNRYLVALTLIGRWVAVGLSSNRKGAGITLLALEQGWWHRESWSSRSHLQTSLQPT
ncbi:hypothetical protein V8F33_006809 [Rhypophila sp. PSN 637]